VKRLIWALRFSPFQMISGLALIAMGGFMLYVGPPESTISAVAESVIWSFGAIPWHLSCIAGVLSLAWALYLGEDAYIGV
jgi:hypothetical protein